MEKRFQKKVEGAIVERGLSVEKGNVTWDSSLIGSRVNSHVDYKIPHRWRGQRTKEPFVRFQRSQRESILRGAIPVLIIGSDAPIINGKKDGCS